MQQRPNHECFSQKFVKLLPGQHGSNRIFRYLKFLNDARGRNKIKLGFNPHIKPNRY